MIDEKKKEAELAFRKVIMNAKIAKIGEKSYCISRINDLNFLSNDEIWEKEGKNDFQATAEVFFVTNIEGGIDVSTGDRIGIKGTVEKENQKYTLVSPIIIESKVNTEYIKTYSDEYSNI